MNAWPNKAVVVGVQNIVMVSSALEEGNVVVNGAMVQRVLSLDAAGMDCWIFIFRYTFNTTLTNNLYPT